MIHHYTANLSFYIGKVKFLNIEQRSYSKSNVNGLLNLSARGASIGQMIVQPARILSEKSCLFKGQRVQQGLYRLQFLFADRNDFYV